MPLQQHNINTDIVVAGGGMAGICAALSAARNGAKVVLLQDRSILGGNASNDVRMHIVGADCHGARKGWRESGIIEEIRLENAYRNPQRSYPFGDLLLYEKVIAEPNITLLLDTYCAGVIMENGDSHPTPQLPVDGIDMIEFIGTAGSISAVRAVREITADEFIINAKFFIDCTGDGRLGYEAGADYRIGREDKTMHGESLGREKSDRHTLGSSILITSRRYEQSMPFYPPAWARKFTPEELKLGRGVGSSWEYGFWWAEWGGQLDTIKDHATTIRHELLAVALGIWDYIKNSGKYPESKNWAMDWIGTIPGKRESRRFLGPYILKQQDLQNAIAFDDEVGYGGWAIDDHPPAGVDAKTEPPFYSHSLSNVYPIPLRSLYSRNIGNLFLAGRLISATHLALCSTRVMATCSVIGQAAGTAAAYCIQHNIPSAAKLSADQKKVKALQQNLLRDDATLLHTSVNDGLDLARMAHTEASSHAEGCPPEKIKDGRLRDEVDQKSGRLLVSHHWRSVPNQPLPQWVELHWQQPITINEVQITFDTGLARTLALTPSNDKGIQGIWGAQPETARDYQLLVDNQAVVIIKGNYQRKHRYILNNARCKRLRLLVEATQGEKYASVAEIRVFGSNS